MQVKITRVGNDGSLPKRQHSDDAGYDIFSAECVYMYPGTRASVSTGIAVAIPEGFAGFILPRSGLAREQGVAILNSPGLVDSGYRGEWKITLINHGSKLCVIERGDRIAQLVVQRVETVEWLAVDALDDTERGHGGFGSTGV